MPHDPEIPVCPTVADRVDFVAGLMSKNEWPMWPDSLLFRQRLAATWGVSESTVRSYSAEAHRRLCLDENDREQLRAQLATKLREIASAASTEPSRVTGLPDWNAAVKAYESLAKFSGIVDEHRLHLSGAVMLEDLDLLKARAATPNDEEE